MGGGPVFIVYASLNLSHNVVVPAATWLFVRGILNIIQFGTVITLCIFVNKIRSYYSRKEERLIVLNLLATHPVAYFYYVVILGGIVWNVLGSGWIGAAYEYYNHSFAVCYLVCIILSWVSVTLSPTFVLCGTKCYACFNIGGLVYNRAKQEPPRVEHSVMSNLLQDESAILDLNQLVKQLNGEGKVISVDDILARRKYVEAAFDLNKSPSTQSTGVENADPHDVIPNVVTNIQCECDENNSYEGQLLNDLMQEMEKQNQSESNVIIMHHDALDEMNEAEVEDKTLREEILKHRAVLMSDDGLRIGSASQPAMAGAVVSTSPRASPGLSPNASPNASPHASSQASTPLSSFLLEQPQPPKEKKKKGKKARGKLSAKDNIVVVDDVLHAPAIAPVEGARDARNEQQHTNAGPFHYFDTNDDYVDLSQQMIDSINHTTFSGNPVSENVNVTYFNASLPCSTKQLFNKQATFLSLVGLLIRRPRRPHQRRRTPSRTRRYHQGTYGYPYVSPARTGRSEQLLVSAANYLIPEVDTFSTSLPSRMISSF